MQPAMQLATIGIAVRPQDSRRFLYSWQAIYVAKQRHNDLRDLRMSRQYAMKMIVIRSRY